MALAAVVAALLVVAVAAEPARAATLTVNSTNDPGDGTCDASECTLREAIATASAGDTVEFAADVSGTITLTSGQLDIDKDLTINSPGADQLAVSGDNASRVFAIASGNEVGIGGLTITGGDSGSSAGGGIRNEGNLTLTDSAVSGNTTGGDGGIFSDGTLTVVRSTISGNSAADGGGIRSGNNQDTDEETATISNSTISGNEASSEGGGVFNLGGLTEIRNSTITENTAGGEGSGVLSAGDDRTTTEVFSSIISGNANDSDVDLGFNFANTFSSQGYNLIGNGEATGAFNSTADRTGVTDPGLGPLADNGGPTRTHAVQQGSPAIDKGDSGDLTQDQRGRPRPVDFRGVSNASGGDGADKGSFELQAGGCTIIGTSGDDDLEGTSGDDVICGLGGDDELIGFAGEDTLVGGLGGDRLFGNNGDDKVFGKGGDDAMTGGPGNDALVGNAGVDSLVGRAGTDMAAGGPDNDRLFGNGSADKVIGNDGDDNMNGGAGADTVVGRAGADRFVGSDGADNLGGGPGDDRIGGGPDDDNLFGNEGNDGLAGNEGDDTLKGGPGRDALRGGPGNDTEIQD